MPTRASETVASSRPPLRAALAPSRRTGTWLSVLSLVAGFGLASGATRAAAAPPPTGAAVATQATSAASGPEIAITFDDLPVHGPLPPGETRIEVARKIIAALQAAGIHGVYGFVNGIRLEQEPASAPVLPAWRAAGFPLGNHTWSHMNLNTSTLAAWEADLLRNQPVLERYMKGRDFRYLRFPYLAEGNTPQKHAAMRAFLAAHHYKIADVTMSFSDYAYNEPYARCMVQGDQAAVARLEKSYLGGAVIEIGRSRQMAKELLGHDIPYVLLMHIGAFDARMLPRLLALYRRHGVRFLTLPEAESNPFYHVDTDLNAPPQPDSLEGRLWARHLPLPKPEDLNWLNTICR